MTDKNDEATALAQVTHACLITDPGGEVRISDVKLFSMLDRYCGGSLLPGMFTAHFSAWQG